MRFGLEVRRKMGIATWCLGFVIAMLWGGLRNVQYEARGIGLAPPVHIASLESGRLAALDVQLHDLVSADDVVARLDPTILEEERDVISANLLAIQAEQAGDAMNNARKFAEGVEDHSLDGARLSASVQADTARVAALNEELAIERKLQASGASSDRRVRDIERDLEVVGARLSASRVAMGVAYSSADAARTRSEASTGANEWHVVAAARMLEQIENRIDRLNLSAGIDGQVTAILRSPGEVVEAGEVVLTVTQRSTSEVVAYLPASAVPRLVVGARASVVRSSGEVLKGHLVSAGVGPQQIPKQLWNNPSYPEWGIPVRVQLSSGQVGAQEPVTVRL